MGPRTYSRLRKYASAVKIPSGPPHFGMFAEIQNCHENPETLETITQSKENQAKRAQSRAQRIEICIGEVGTRPADLPEALLSNLA